MDHIERVYTSIKHEEPYQVPKGEIGQGIDEKLVKELLREECDIPGIEEAKFYNKKKILELLHMDLLSIGLDYIGFPHIEEVGRDKDGHMIYRGNLLGREYISFGYGAAKDVKPVYL